MKRNYFRQSDRFPKRNGVIRDECLSAKSLEYLLLTAQQNRALYDTFYEHFLSCEKCMRRIKNLERFYRILDKELMNPVSAKTVEFARTLNESY